MSLRRDSRLVQSGDYFIAVSDQAQERQAHIQDARTRGAGRIIAEDKHADQICGHARFAWARLHAAASGADQVKTPIIGVTGTDGKTTCASFIQHLLGPGAARVGTLGIDNGRRQKSGSLTTPAPETIHELLLDLDETCPGVAVEISSHGAEQERLAGLQLQALIVTGLGHDHLDYHKTRERYLQAKLKTVRLLPAGALCVVNADDELAHIVKHAVFSVGGRCVSIGCTQGDIRLIQEGPQAWRLQSAYADYPLQMPMIGYHNAWNAAAAAVAVGALDIPLSTALADCADAPQVPGRLELCSSRPLCYVDYAHTPRALETTIKALREAHPNKKIITVFGCGGDRDHEKRAAMGTIAATTEYIFVTNDNPRSEDPLKIAQAICGEHCSARAISDLSPDRKFFIELDRAQAIRHAFAIADQECVVLVAGKGHESEQIIGQQRIAWDDRAFIRQLEEAHT